METKYYVMEDCRSGWVAKDLSCEDIAYLEAWFKIKDFVKKEYGNYFANGVEFEWKHDPFYKIKFCVDKNGNAYIAKGSHSCDYDDFVDNPTKLRGGLGIYNSSPDSNTKLSTITLKMIVEVVNDWDIIKGFLEGRKSKLNKVYNFRP